jgi:PAS domain-containing protein
LSSGVSQQASWLLENGPRELELLLRAVLYHPAAPLLILDDERNYRDASVGAGNLLGLPRNRIIGQKMDDFADPSVRPGISELWKAFLSKGEQKGTLRLAHSNGNVSDVEYSAKSNVLPVRHVWALRDKTAAQAQAFAEAGDDEIPSWVQDYALFLLDVNGCIVRWYSGAERIYAYSEDEVAGKDVGFVYPGDKNPHPEPRQELQRSAAAGHFRH